MLLIKKRLTAALFDPKLKPTLTFTLTLLLKIGSKCVDLKGHFVLDVKIARASLSVVLTSLPHLVLKSQESISQLWTPN